MKSWELKLHPRWNISGKSYKMDKSLNCIASENINTKDEK